MITFEEEQGGWRGVGRRGRQWQITQVKTGWRLQFVDIGDTTPVNAGIFGTLAAAQADADR
ncbi:MAG: hypothetical protein ABWX84_15550 [Nocardioides sp.]